MVSNLIISYEKKYLERMLIIMIMAVHGLTAKCI